MKKNNAFALTLAVLAAAPLAAELVPAALFNHNMVLQRDRKVAVWGTADAGADVTVAFAGATAKGRAGADGRWRVDLPPMQADATPRAMTISSSKGDTLVYTNAVVGEVWLCGGQSNMTFAMWPRPSVGQHAGRERNGYYDIMLTDAPAVRGVRMNECWSAEPKDHARLAWFAFTPGNGGNFSGAAWHYAMRLHRALKVPVGVIESAWGGSCIETWIPPAAYAASKSFKDLATRPIRTEPNEQEKAHQKKTGRGPSLHQQPRACWNAMIHPLAPYALRGAIWYQGCTNRGKWREYYEMLETLRAGWGAAFECPDMPFFLCQIAPYGYTSEERDNGETQIREEMQASVVKSQMILGGTAAVALLVAALNIANTMMMSITERTREIGVLKVLGTIRSDIFKMFLTEALIVGVIGGAAGLILSFIAKWLIPVIFASQELRCVLPWWLAVCGVLFAGAVAIAAAWMPARKATLISPNEAIRSE